MLPYLERQITRYRIIGTDRYHMHVRTLDKGMTTRDDMERISRLYYSAAGDHTDVARASMICGAQAFQAE